VVLSHRHTYSKDIAKRYGCDSYDEIEGIIDLA
jgi:hypothetical protein